jgi:hypothetical protein
MADTTVDYQAVLADLEARRASFNRAIDGAISSIRQILALTSVTGEVGTGSLKLNGLAPTVQIDTDGFFGLSLVDAAKKYLKVSRRKLTNPEIAEGLDKAGFVHTSKDFTNTVGSTLLRALNQGDKEIFRQGRYWLLSEWAPGRRRSMGKVEDPEVELEDQKEEEVGEEG